MLKGFAIRLIPALVLLLAPFSIAESAPAAAPASIRFLQGDRNDNAYLAALEIRLNPGYVTYWRTPGDAGMPPVFDWSGSDNVADIKVSWPAPSRIDEAGSIVYGFHDSVTLPLRIVPKQAGKPVSLKLKLHYGACKELCIPVESEASAVLNGAGLETASVRRAMDDLPKPVKMGEANTPFSVVSTQAIEGKDSFTVVLNAPEGEKVQLFAEGPAGWFLSTSDAQPGSTPGSFNVTVSIMAAPKAQMIGTPIDLTARAGNHTIETTISRPEN